MGLLEIFAVSIMLVFRVTFATGTNRDAVHSTNNNNHWKVTRQPSSSSILMTGVFQG